MAVKKERLDVLIFEQGFVSSREKAKTLIMTGNVFVNGQREDKAGTKISVEALITVKDAGMPYVSRGGFKLEKALNQFELDLNNKLCMDVGASTGGFTDCMLQNGARKVYAIDVGRGQLDWKLRQDERVVSMEKTNIRYVTTTEVSEPIEFVSVDVSFISLTKILAPVYQLMKETSEIVCLIKPQFEAGREHVGKKGVVRDFDIHIEVIERVMAYARGLNFIPLHLSFSPIKGPEGNVEYLMHMGKYDESQTNERQQNPLDFAPIIKAVVDEAKLI